MATDMVKKKKNGHGRHGRSDMPHGHGHGHGRSSSCLMPLGLWLRLECSLDSLSIVSTDHQIDRGLSVSLRLYEMCHVLVIV